MTHMTLSPTVTLHVTGHIATVTIHNPPINAASHSVRQGLVAAVQHSQTIAKCQAVLLTCEGRTFVAGADVREFNAPSQDPTLPDVLNQIEASPLPWIAALHGTVLGGGCELALACQYRIAVPGTKIGLPEVALGLIPGAGGTARLPRLIPAMKALDMIVSGKPQMIESLGALGLVDHLIQDGEAFSDSVDQLLSSASGPALKTSDRPIRDMPDAAEWQAAITKLTAKAKGQHAPHEAAAAVSDALKLPFTEAAKSARARFLALKNSDQATALRHIFFAERATAKVPELQDIPARSHQQIGIVGGGTMGAGISAACLLAGLSVSMVEITAEAAELGKTRVLDLLQKSLDRNIITPEKHAAIIAAFDVSASYGALSSCDLVIEAVFEDMDVKKRVFQELDKVTPATAIIATNTSYLDVAEIASSVADPSRVIGLHFFSPAHIMKLLEIIRPRTTALDVQVTALSFAKTLGKIPVFAGVCDGFIGNRIMSAYRRECEYMLEEGALPWEIDAAMVDFGMPLGLFQMMDLAGLDISWAMRKRQAKTRDPSERYVAIADTLCELGRFGQKNGKGWYDYASGTALPDPLVETLIKEASKAKHITRRTFTQSEIMARILKAMQETGRALLSEGNARMADDIDVVMVNAYGFPRWRGGPMFMSQTQTAAPD